MKSDLENLKQLYPNMDYANGMLFKSKKHSSALYTEEETTAMIIEHYEGQTITVAHPSGDPQLEEFKEVNGVEYIEHTFNGNLEEAYKSI